MKAVLISTDYIKTQDGNYKVLEMNTNTALDVLSEDQYNYLDLTELESFITSNGFTKVNLIYNGLSKGFKSKLETICTGSTNVTFNSFETQHGSITVPYMEDDETTLTIRISYDTTAIVDDEYCRDKYGFIKALGNDTLKPKVFIPNVVDDFQTLTEFTYTGTKPNFIIKKRYPNYDKFVYPRLFKITSLEELIAVKQLVENDNEYLQEYVVSELVNGKHNILRSIDLIYGSNLDIINLGGYKEIHTLKADIWQDTYGTNNEIEKSNRPKYITHYGNLEESRKPYVADIDDNIIMSDNSFKSFGDIVVGDVVKSILITGLPENENQYNTADWTGSYTDFVNNFAMDTAVVISKTESNTIDDLFVRITLEDGITWDDNIGTNILTKNGDVIKFKHVNDLVIGDTIEMVNVLDNTIVNKTIQNLEPVFKYGVILGDIDVETKDVFLSIIENNLALIQHNTCSGTCFSKTGNIYPSCKSYSQCNTCALPQCAPAK
jgi:hypothetical protein